MLGITYFKALEGRAFNLAEIPYLSGTGSIAVRGMPVPVSWELSVQLTGASLLYVSTTEPIAIEDTACSLTGVTSDDQWSIEAEDYWVSGTDMGGESLMFGSAPLIVLRKKHVSPPDRILASILNFDFAGWEITQEDDTLPAKRIRFAFQERDCEFRLRADIGEVRDLLDREVVTHAAMSRLAVPVLPGESLESVASTLDSMCWFLSFLNLNANFAPVRRYQFEGQDVSIVIRDVITSPFHRHPLVDNRRILFGLPSVLERCLPKFISLEKDLSLRRFISSVLGAHEGKFLENQLAGLVMSMEILLTKYLKHQAPEVDTAKLNLQQKLGRANKLIKHIPSELSGDNLRQRIRNPLFHQGDVTELSAQEMAGFLNEYFDLLVQIVFYIVEYRGQFLSRTDDKPTQTWLMADRIRSR